MTWPSPSARKRHATVFPSRGGSGHVQRVITVKRSREAAKVSFTLAPRMPFGANVFRLAAE
eukprot:9567917-Alexandrium_andersonii.AAC.1